MKQPNIAMNVQTQRKITNELITMEWITLISIFALVSVGTKLNGIYLGKTIQTYCKKDIHPLIVPNTNPSVYQQPLGILKGMIPNLKALI